MEQRRQSMRALENGWLFFFFFLADLLIISGDTAKRMSPVCRQPDLELRLNHYVLFQKTKY